MRRYSLNQHGSVTTEWIVAITAILAIGVALFTFYKTYLNPPPPPPPKPFEPSIALGTPMLHEGLGVLRIILSVPITNNGDEPGCISDIALTLQSKTLKTQWSFFPAWKINLERYLKANKNKEDPSQAFEALVSPTQLPGKNKQEQVFLFVPRTSSALKVQPLRAKDLTPGETYIVSVFLLRGGSKCETPITSTYDLYASKEFVLEKDELKDLALGFAVQPMDTAGDSIRDKFVRGPN